MRIQRLRVVTWIVGEIGGNPHFHILFSILCTVSVYGVPPPQVMSVLRSGDNGYERAGNQYPCPLLPNLDKEGVQSWQGRAASTLWVPQCLSPGPLCCTATAHRSQPLRPCFYQLLPISSPSLLHTTGNFMLVRDSIRWMPSTLISSTSPNSKLMKHNKKQLLCLLQFFFFNGAHKFQGGKYPCEWF